MGGTRMPGSTNGRSGGGQEDGGGGRLYGFYRRVVRPVPALRALARGYFLPRRIERWRKGIVYRLLGVHLFSRMVPTGGTAIRRVTGASMPGYTLARPTLSSARRHFLRACAFEAGHLLVFLVMSAAIVACVLLDRVPLAIGGAVANLLINVYPILLQRYTRVRIASLAERGNG